MIEQLDIQRSVKVLKAIANENRLQILRWILNPVEHFEPQVDGDLVEDGVCIGRITDKIKLSQPTVTNHMKLLCDAGLVSSKKIKNWVFYKPHREKIRQALESVI